MQMPVEIEAILALVSQTECRARGEFVLQTKRPRRLVAHTLNIHVHGRAGEGAGLNVEGGVERDVAAGEAESRSDRQIVGDSIRNGRQNFDESAERLVTLISLDGVVEIPAGRKPCRGI